MMLRFEKVSRFKDDEEIKIPQRATEFSAGYDFCVAEDIIIPSLYTTQGNLHNYYMDVTHNFNHPRLTLDEVAKYTKESKTKVTLVPTGIKCQLSHNTYLELSMRSSIPLKTYLVLGNGVGIIDADYYNNPDNEGEIYFQIINLSPFDIKLKKGDRIGQGIIKEYRTVRGDNAEGVRSGGFGSTGSA